MHNDAASCTAIVGVGIRKLSVRGCCQIIAALYDASTRESRVSVWQLANLRRSCLQSGSSICACTEPLRNYTYAKTTKHSGNGTGNDHCLRWEVGGTAKPSDQSIHNSSGERTRGKEQFYARDKACGETCEARCETWLCFYFEDAEWRRDESFDGRDAASLCRGAFGTED
jgi:hypothetical protein